MKKISMFFLAVAMTAVFTVPSFAMLRKDLQTVKGTVTYINSTRTEITVKDGNTGKDVTFSSPGVGAEIATGSLVLVMYKTGTTTAKSVRIVVPRVKRSAVKAGVAAPIYTAAPIPAVSSKKSAW